VRLRVARGLGLGVLAVLAVVALVGRWLAAGVEPVQLQLHLPQAGAADVFRWWALASQNTALLVLVSTLVASVVGGVLGASGVYGDSGLLGVLLRLVEFFGAVPAIILVGILRLADPSGGVLGLFLTFSMLRTLEVAQLVRAHVLHTLPSDFVEASRALGASRRWQLRVHVLPRLVQPLVTNLLLGASTLVGLEAALSFTGLGLPSRVPSWGGGLAALARGGATPTAAVSVVASIAATCAALYGLAVSLERRERRSPGFGARLAPPVRELGAEQQGS
jgi:oligopeptide transport system permease protein